MANTQGPLLLSFNYCCECIGRDITDLITTSKKNKPS